MKQGNFLHLEKVSSLWRQQYLKGRFRIQVDID